MANAIDWDKSTSNKMVYKNTPLANSVWNATNGAVSVGRLDLDDPSKTITRQITNVAAGTWLTDAVNVAQLKALEAKMTETSTIKTDLHLINGTETISGDEGQSNEIKGYKVDKNGKLTLKVEDVTHTTEGYDVNIDLSALKSSGGWTAQANGTEVTPKDEKINFKNGNNISVTNTADGEITIAATGLANTDLSNITELGQTTITKLAKDADIRVKEGSYAVDENGKVTMDYVDGNGNLIEGKKLTITGITSTNANNAAVVYVDNDKNKSLHSTNSGTVGTGSIALGKEANAVNDSIAIGDRASVVKNSGVALGNDSYAGHKGTSLGNSAKSGREGATVVGDHTNSAGVYSTILGTDSVINSDGTSLTIPILGTIQVSKNIQGAAATIVGAKNTVDNKNGKAYSGVANNVMGAANTIKASNGVTIQGSGNTVTNAYKDMNITSSEGRDIVFGDYSKLAQKDSGAVAVIGGANTISNQTSSTVIGFGNTVAGTNSTGTNSTGVFTAGSHNTLTYVSNSLIMGDNNTLENRTNVISLGNKNTIEANNAVAIGNGAAVEADGGVALGVGSVANTDKGIQGYLADNTDTSATWKATGAALSVGSKEITRQITNVAAGKEDTDAVNVAQLTKVNNKADTAIETANQGWNLSTNRSKKTAANVKPGDIVDFTGDNNISVSNTGKDVSVKLNKELKDLTSVTTNNAYVTTVDESDNSVTNVKYVKDQIADAALSAGDGISIADKKINVKLKDGEQNLVVNNDGLSLKNDITLGDTRDMSVVISGSKGTINASQSISAGNVIMDGAAGDITNLTNTTLNSKDFATKGRAATEEQLKAVQQQINSDITTIGSKTFGLKGDSGTDAATNTLGNTVQVKGDNNITSTVKEGENKEKYLEIGLRKDLTGLNSVTTNNAYVTNVDASKNESVTNVKYVKDQIADAALSAGDGISITNKKINVKIKDDEENLVVNENGLSMNKELKGIQSITGIGTGAGKISFDGSNVKINNITFNSDGRIQNVAKGTATTDAVNVGQLNDAINDAISKGDTDTHIKAGDYTVDTITDSTGKTSQGVSMDIVDKDGVSKGKVTIKDVAKASDLGDVSKLNEDLQNTDESGTHTSVVEAVNKVDDKVNKVDKNVGDLNYVEGKKGNYVTNGDSVTVSIGKLDKALKSAEETAGKHTVVNGSNNIDVTNTAKEGEAANYQVSLKDDITLGSGENHVSIKGTEGTIEATGNIKAGSFSTGTITINKDNSNTIDGLANKTWDATNTDQYKDSGKAATEAQLQQAMGGTVQYDRNSQGNVTNNITLNKGGDSVTITNVADGKVEKGSTDAVNGGQLYETNQAIANNATNISSLSHSLSNLDNRVNKVGAGAAALAALHPLDFDPDAKWDFAAGYGNYRGTNAAAIGAYYRPNEDTMFSVGGTFGNGENMVNAGVSFKLGAGSSHVSTSRVAMAKEIKELRSELEAMKSAMLDANAGKKIDTSKLQLFPDVPQNHWAYEYVAQLAGNGMIDGYPDGSFAGDRPMTRYEFAAILYRAMTKGAVLSDKILNEFSHELEYFTVDTVAKDKAGNPTIQRVRTVKDNKNK